MDGPESELYPLLCLLLLCNSESISIEISCINAICDLVTRAGFI